MLPKTLGRKKTKKQSGCRKKKVLLQVLVLCHLTDKTCSTETEIWRLEVDHSPAHCNSSPFPFLQPSTLYDCRLKPSPGVPPGRQVFARLITSKHMPPPLLPVYIFNPSLPLFVFSLFSPLFNQYLSPLLLFLSFFVPCLSALLTHPTPLFLTLCLSSCVSHQPRDIKRHAPPPPAPPLVL